MEGTIQVTLRKPVWKYDDQGSPYVDYWAEFKNEWARRLDRAAGREVVDEVAHVTFDATFRVRLHSQIKDIAPGWELVDWEGNEYTVQDVKRVGTERVDIQRINKVDLGCILRKEIDHG